MGGRGGGLYVTGDDVTIDSNVIQGNTANGGEFLTGGGGVNITEGDIQFINNIVTGNSVSGNVTLGAGISVVGCAPILKHNTIASNTGGAGQGVYVEGGGNPGQPVLYNNILASQAIGIQVDSSVAQNLATLYGILWFDNSSNYLGNVFTFDEIIGDPGFADPVGSDYHLTPDSAAINAGRSDGGVESDIDGESRPHYAGYDLGADEWWPLVAVKTVSAEQAQAGEVLTYSLILENTTKEDMVVSLTDDLPAGVSYLGPLDYNYGSGNYLNGVVSWSGTVLVDTPLLISWPVIIDVQASGDIVNSADISEPYGDFETNPAVVNVVEETVWVYLPIVIRH